MYEWANKETKALKEEVIKAINSARNPKEISMKEQEYDEKFDQLKRKIDEAFAKV